MKKLVCLILVLILTLAAAACSPVSPKENDLAGEDAELLVHFIDVGQGDSTLLESKGEFVLIDAGENAYGTTVADYLNSRGVKTLRYVIATHPHSDHVGGLDTVISRFAAENFITVETDQSTKTWLDVLDAVDKSGANYIDAVPGTTYTFGAARFTILAPLGNSYEGYNNYSVVTKVTCGSVSFLLAGDAEKQSENEMIDSGADLSADVLKCGHHGSSTSSTAKFLKAVNPSCAVISCGKNNDYGHPHKETLKKLNLLGCQIYRTDEQGTIIARTDGETIRFSTPDSKALGESSHSDETASELYYIGNLNSHIFHYPNCAGVKSMSEKNKIEFAAREDAIAQGYTPCSQCEP